MFRNTVYNAPSSAPSQHDIRACADEAAQINRATQLSCMIARLSPLTRSFPCCTRAEINHFDVCISAGNHVHRVHTTASFIWVLYVFLFFLQFFAKLYSNVLIFFCILHATLFGNPCAKIIKIFLLLSKWMTSTQTPFHFDAQSKHSAAACAVKCPRNLRTVCIKYFATASTARVIYIWLTQSVMLTTMKKSVEKLV